MAALRISVDPIENHCAERDIIEGKLALDDKDILELGCGRADLTRLIARGGPRRGCSPLRWTKSSMRKI